MGQVSQKKVVAQRDYHLWSTLTSDKISSKGQWASFRLNYEGADTLFVVSVKKTKYAFPHGISGEFNGEGWFACMKADSLALQNLISGKASYFPNISSYEFSGDGKYLLLFGNNNEGSQRLKVYDMESQIVVEVKYINEWAWDQKARNAIVYVTEKENVEIMELHSRFAKRRILGSNGGSIKNLIWQNNTISFNQYNNSVGKLYAYQVATGNLSILDPRTCLNFPENMRFADGFGSIMISNDGKRIFFKLKENRTEESAEDIVQVWNADDKQIYPNVKMYGDLTLQDKVAVWFTDTGKILQISNRDLPSALISLNGNYALIWNALEYEPQWDFEGPSDISIINIETGVSKLLLKAYPATAAAPLFSPSGNYVSYGKDGNWWIYDVLKEKHFNITANLGVSVVDSVYDRAGDKPFYGIAGWSKAEEKLLLYDKYDIWEITPDGSQIKRLTGGRKDHITFRFEALRVNERPKMDGMAKSAAIIDLTRKLLLSAQNTETGYSGFYSYDSKTGANQIIWDYRRLDRAVQAKDGFAFTFISQRFDDPPTLMHTDLSATLIELYQSNSQHKHYLWGRTEKISYIVDGKPLSGILIYPADYDMEKDYPMVVSIYERQSGSLHRYVNPTVYNETGINFATLSAKGYFILLPDIGYTIGASGESAKKCVLAAVDAVLLRWCINQEKIAVTGHSYGGFETDYIITQTDRFVAAVSGGAVTDLVSGYLYYNSNYARPDYWRFEHQQQRIGKSLYESTGSYLNNSPILHAGNVKTPLLSWTGEEDKQVYYFQSIEFYLALRRLKKEHTLLIYPGESHTIVGKSNQADLTKRIEDWFAKFLLQ